MLNISVKQFFNSYVPILFAFISSKLITQTDLLMIAPLGEVSTAAFAIPSRVMMIDIIIAFAVAPVVSVLIASASNLRKKIITINKFLSFSVYISVVLLLLGLSLYPLIIQASIENVLVVELATVAVLWLTVAIPFRLIQFVCTMVIYATGKGKQLIPIIIFSVLLNFALNWLLIYYFEIGFAGAFISTLITSFIELVLSIYVIREFIHVNRIFSPPRLSWVKSIINHIGAEWGRLISWQLASFCVLSIISAKSQWLDRQAAYAVVMEVQALLFIPFIAAMRCTAIIMAPHKDIDVTVLYHSLKQVLWTGLLLLIPLISLIVYYSTSIGTSLFHLGSKSIQWWTPFIIVTCLFLPIYLLKSLQMGIWQSQQKFSHVFLADSLTQWFILIPIFYWGLSTNNPWITWSSLPIAEIIMTIILYNLRWKLNSAYSIRGKNCGQLAEN